MIIPIHKKHFLIYSLMVLCGIATSSVNAATVTSLTSGNWSSPSTWQITLTQPGTIVAQTNSRIITGSALANFTSTLSVGNQILNTSNQVIGIVESIQSSTSLTLVSNAAFQMNNAGWNSRGVGAGDNVVIASGNTVSVDGNFTCASVTMQIANANNTLEILGSNTLNITGNLFMNVPNSGNVSTVNVAAGTIVCSSLNMNATTAGNNNIINISSGRLNINGNTTTGTTGCQINITGAGTLELGGTVGPFILNPGTQLSTVVYDANAAQTMKALVYNNLTIAGSGVKTVTSSTTVNATLSIEGTATLSDAITSFGSDAGIRYNTTTARSTGIEWPTIFNGTRGIIITNTGAITLEGTKNVNSGPMQITTGASFNTNNFALTLGGAFTNAGTFTATASLLTFNGNLVNQNIFNANSAQVRVSADFINTGTYNGGSSQFNIRGTANTQNIDGFSTTGLFNFTKTAGTAILLGNVSAGSIIFAGTGGTLDCGSNRTHTFTGSLTLTNGTLNGNTSTLIFNGSTSGTGVVFNEGSSTVKYLGTTQDIPGFRYFNLELGNSGVKTMSTSLNTITNRFILSGTVSVQQRGSLLLNGDFVMTGSSFFRASSFDLTINDSLIIGDGSNAVFRLGTVRLRNFNNLIIQAGGSFVDSINSTYNINGNISNFGTFTGGANFTTVNFTGINKTMRGIIIINKIANFTGSYTNNGSLTFNEAPMGSGTLSNGVSSTINFNFAGSVDITNFIASATGNNVNYTFAGNQSIATIDYFNLSLSGSGTKTLSIGTTAIANNFTLSGTASSTGVINLSVGNNFTLNNNANFNFSNFNYTFGGNFIANSGTTLNTSNANLIFTGNNKVFQNSNGVSSINSIQITNGRISFITSIIVRDLIINTIAAFDFAGFSANLEIQNTIAGEGKIIAGLCNSTSNTITLSGTNNDMGTLNLDANNYYLNSLQFLKTSGVVSINSNIGIGVELFITNLGNAGIEFKKNVELVNDIIITSTSTLPKVILASTASLIFNDCLNSGALVTIPNNFFVTPPTIKNLSVSRANGVNIGNDVISVSEVLSLQNGTLNTNNNLILLSTANKTARVAKVTGAITGNVTVQRFIPGGNNKRQWRFLSSPINVAGSTALSQYQDDIFVTAPAQASGGFDVNPFASNASIRTYTESVSGSLNNGWTNPTNINNTIPTGIGAEVFVRGSRNLANPFLNWTVPDDVTIDYVGSLNTGSISPSITFTNTGSGNNDGFNLVGNPYASPINFDTAGIIKTNIENKYWCFNPNTTLYGAFNATTGLSINGMTKYISSGQAFFVRAIASSPQITFTEDAKTSSEGNNYFRPNTNNSIYPYVKIQLVKNPDEVDESLIILYPDGTYEGNDAGDMLKFFNNALNLYSKSSDGLNMSMNAIPNTKLTDTIKLSVWSYDSSSVSTTEHSLNFSRLESIDNSLNVYLIDAYTKSKIDVRKNPDYTFLITNDANSYGNNRFMLVFTKTNTAVPSNQSLLDKLVLYPNPVADKLYLQVNDKTLKSELSSYEIFDVIGNKISEGNLDLNENNISISINYLQTGMYLLSVKNENEYKVFKFIKK